MKIFVLNNNGKIKTHGFTTLLDACQVFGLNYERARRGKRTFRGNKILIEIDVIKSKRDRNSNNLSKYVDKLLNKRIEDIKSGVPVLDQEQQKMKSYRDDINFDEV